MGNHETEVDPGNSNIVYLYLTGDSVSESVNCIHFTKSSSDFNSCFWVYEREKRRNVCWLFLWHSH